MEAGMNKREREAIEGLVSEFRQRLIDNYHEVHKIALEAGSQPLRFENLCQQICDYYGLDLSKLMSTATRQHEYTKARSVVYWIMRQRNSGFNYSLSKIAEMMGGFNHSTVVHSIKKFEDEIEYDKDFRFDIDNFLRIVGLKVTKMNGRYYLQILQNETVSD